MNTVNYLKQYMIYKKKYLKLKRKKQIGGTYEEEMIESKKKTIMDLITQLNKSTELGQQITLKGGIIHNINELLKNENFDGREEYVKLLEKYMGEEKGQEEEVEEVEEKEEEEVVEEVEEKEEEEVVEEVVEEIIDHYKHEERYKTEIHDLLLELVNYALSEDGIYMAMYHIYISPNPIAKDRKEKLEKRRDYYGLALFVFCKQLAQIGYIIDDILQKITIKFTDDKDDTYYNLRTELRIELNIIRKLIDNITAPINGRADNLINLLHSESVLFDEKEAKLDNNNNLHKKYYGIIVFMSLLWLYIPFDLHNMNIPLHEIETIIIIMANKMLINTDLLSMDVKEWILGDIPESIEKIHGRIRKSAISHIIAFDLYINKIVKIIENHNKSDLTDIKSVFEDEINKLFENEL